MLFDKNWLNTIDKSGTAITNSVVIETITTESNWPDGVYNGSTTGLAINNYYADNNNKLMYYYDGIKLHRWSIDNVTL